METIIGLDVKLWFKFLQKKVYRCIYTCLNPYCAKIFGVMDITMQNMEKTRGETETWELQRGSVWMLQYLDDASK